MICMHQSSTSLFSYPGSCNSHFPFYDPGLGYDRRVFTLSLRRGSGRAPQVLITCLERFRHGGGFLPSTLDPTRDLPYRALHPSFLALVSLAFLKCVLKGRLRPAGSSSWVAHSGRRPVTSRWAPRTLGPSPRRGRSTPNRSRRPPLISLSHDLVLHYNCYTRTVTVVRP